MVRPLKPRRLFFDPQATYFKPRAIPLSSLEEVSLTMEEVEALRLCDYKEMSQKEASVEMGISQSTIQRILTLARKKVVEAIVEGKAIRIEKK
ncbi:hypothetical protein MNSC_10870 [Minisyncoccus archaeophilus]|jgi:predicted DNA-binding protein (UPF0251 family)|uniref:DUF134 domain-containing protein n=1 Tax=Minisyncoccus archaeiphilus TaxID=3238481 RepID=UPI00399C6FA3